MDASLLTDHVERFNAGVRTGDFGPMLAAFAPDAEMRFEGVAFGPLRGRQQIAAGYAERPPDDEVRLLTPPHGEDDAVVADYAWAADGRRAGRMLLTAENGLITSLVITFERSSAAP